MSKQTSPNYTIFKIKDEMVVSRVSPQPSSSAVS